MARRSTEVCSTSGSTPASAISEPPRAASVRPFSVSGTSTQPVKRFFAFHSLSPWRSRTRVYGALVMRVSLVAAVRPAELGDGASAERSGAAGDLHVAVRGVVGGHDRSVDGDRFATVEREGELQEVARHDPLP